MTRYGLRFLQWLYTFLVIALGGCAWILGHLIGIAIRGFVSGFEENGRDWFPV